MLQTQLGYERNGEDKIQALFSERFNGGVRKAKFKKTMSFVVQHSNFN